MNTCPKCGQTLPPEPPLFGLNLGPISEAIVRRLHRAGSYGVRSDQLFESIYCGVDGGTHKSMHVLISRIKKKLPPHIRLEHIPNKNHYSFGTYRLVVQ